MTVQEFANLRKLGKISMCYLSTLDDAGAVVKNYKFDNVIAGTVNINQDKPEENSVDSEFYSEALETIYTLGKIRVSIESIDLSNDFLSEVLGYTIIGDNVYAPSSYTPKFIKFEFTFATSKDTIVIPKVKIAGTLLGEGLKVGTMKTSLEGTPALVPIEGATNGEKSPLYIKKDGAVGIETADE